MEPETHQNPPSFSVKTRLSPDVYKKNDAKFQKNTFKTLSIHQGEKELIRLHGDFLEDDFEETLALFQSNEVSIPEDLDPAPIETLIKYFYLKEIPTTPLSDFFPLMQLAYFLKVQSLIIEMKGFLLSQINTPNQVLEIFKRSMEFLLIFPETEFISEILKESIAFLIKADKNADILKSFNADFFHKLKANYTEQTFKFFMGLFKENKASNELMMEFLVLYRKTLVSYFIGQNANFNKEKYYQRFIEKYLDLANLNMKDIGEYLRKLEAEEDFDMKDLMINAMSDNIMENKKNIKVLETIFKDLEQKIQDLQSKYDKELEQKIQDLQAKYDKDLEQKIQDLQAKYDKDLEQKIQDLQAKNEQFQENSDAKMKDFQLKNEDFEAKNENRLGIFEENFQLRNQDFEAKNENRLGIFEENQQKKTLEFEETMKLSLDEKFRVFEEKLLKKLKIEEEERKKPEENLKKSPISELTSNYEFSSQSIKNNCFVLSNSNKTVEKISPNKWDGLLCFERALFGGSLDKKVFSIKIEKTTNSNIFIGFVVKTADNSNKGFYQTSSSFMLYLYNGQFYSRSINSDYLNYLVNYQTVSVNQIYTTILDVKEKTIRFLRNGEALGEPKTIDLKPEEIDLMSPCVDIYFQADKVSLVQL